MSTNEINESDRNELERYLNHFEDMCQFCNDGIITFEHIKNMHGPVLRKIKQDILEKPFCKDLKSNPNLFENLKTVLEKID